MEINAQTVTAIISGVVAATTAIAGIIVGIKKARENEKREDERREEERQMRMNIMRRQNSYSQDNSYFNGLPIYDPNVQMQRNMQSQMNQMNQQIMSYQMKINDLESRLQQQYMRNSIPHQMQMGMYMPTPSPMYYSQPVQQTPRYGYGYSNMVNDETIWAGERAYGTPGVMYQKPITQTRYNNNCGYGYGYGYA